MGVVLKAHPKAGETYLVTGDDRLVYVLVPSRHFRYPPASEWPEKSREWVERWRPVLSASADELEVDASIQGDDTLFKNFNTIDREDGTATPFHVRLKIDTFNWRLYTYENDDALSEYSLSNGDHPPGWVKNLWLPAPLTQNLLFELSPPVGLTDSGGP